MLAAYEHFYEINIASILLLNLIVNCGHPGELLSALNLSVPDIEDYGLPIEGSTIRFRCPSGLELTGNPTSAICTENEVWEPSNFTGLMCTNSSGKEFMMLARIMCTCVKLHVYVIFNLAQVHTHPSMFTLKVRITNTMSCHYAYCIRTCTLSRFYIHESITW